MTFDELKGALDILHLPERATLRQIKDRYRQLAKSHHPDRGGADAEAIRRINEAYRLVAAYCADYRFSFSREEFFEQNPEERLREQFGHDGIWRG